MSIDQNISNHLYKSQKKELPYQPGDRVQVRITKLVDYGAFAVTKDEHLASGLIHISQIPEHLELHTQQIIEAEIRQVKEDNKLELSLAHHDKKENPFQVLASIKAPLPEQQPPADEIQEIIQYLSKEFGLVSEESKQKVEAMVRKMGVFHFTMAMMKALPTFKRDLVHHFLKEMEQRGNHL
ncbi:S1 RNA-binding domain-containing protein [Laceyella tengchongensis]|uniref:S1 RNA-binding domain-containing protein n=1 Tax=Laceyella tengchongensis TaxID=574699 RepID=UPI0012B8021A|nr:hypothetical protein [Laceyella tengchongensis]